VHQGDWDKQKGVYHINAVDEVTQFQVVCTVEKISEAYLIPALEQLLAAFPFRIRGFHSDNGSEYINGRVARLLGKLLIEFTKRGGGAKTLWPCSHSPTLGATHQCF
jgi:transposase InsO family protein